VNNIQVQIRMPKQLREKADKVAAANSRKFSDWTRVLIEREVKQYEQMMAQYDPPASAEVIEHRKQASK